MWSVLIQAKFSESSAGVILRLNRVDLSQTIKILSVLLPILCASLDQAKCAMNAKAWAKKETNTQTISDKIQNMRQTACLSLKRNRNFDNDQAKNSRYELISYKEAVCVCVSGCVYMFLVLDSK